MHRELRAAPVRILKIAGQWRAVQVNKKSVGFSVPSGLLGHCFETKHILGFACARLLRTIKNPDLFNIFIITLLTTSIYQEVSRLKYLK